MKYSYRFYFLAFILLLTSSFLNSGCDLFGEEDPPQSNDPVEEGCAALSSTPWVPEIELTQSQDTGGQTSWETYPASGLVLGRSQGVTEDHLLEVKFQMEEDLGEAGSITLLAQASPTKVPSVIHPLLVSLDDGKREWVNFPLEGGCRENGFFKRDPGALYPHPDCQTQTPNAYLGYDNWFQHNIFQAGFISSNTFPNCRFKSVGNTDLNECEFRDLETGAGVEYTARYVLLADSQRQVSGFMGDVEVSVFKKKDENRDEGGMEINVVLVGEKNVKASRTAKGKRNLNALFQHVVNHYGEAHIQIRRINIIEWGCPEGGDGYAVLDINQMGKLFERGSSVLDSKTQGRSINLFMISQFIQGGVLGVSGAIGGPPLHGTPLSGVVMATMKGLDRYNPQCGGSAPCLLADQEAEFVDMAATITHEMGHYFGLNHLSERNGLYHDFLPDTPECRADTQTGSVTIRSCLQEASCAKVCSQYDPSGGVFCPEESSCQFNHAMYYSSKLFNEAQDAGDGNLFSADSQDILQLHPLIQ